MICLKLVPLSLAIAVALPLSSMAQMADEHATREHHAHSIPDGSFGAPREPGQSAFAAIAEVVELLRSDPNTDWAMVNIEALRQHLIDMDNVTVRASVSSRDVEGGAAFDVTSADPDVAASVDRMVRAHAAAMPEGDGMSMEMEPIPGGARLTVTGPDSAMIRGLGFIGLMTIGMHHQSHHFALAKGEKPHAH